MMPRDRSPSPQRPAKYAKYAKVAATTTRQHLLEGGALQFDPRMEVCVGLQFKVKHANHDWGGLWEVENVERRVAGLSPKVVIARADPPTSRTLLLDERVQISKRRQLVVENMILDGAHNLCQAVQDPQRNRKRREKRACQHLAAHKSIAPLAKPRQMPKPLPTHQHVPNFEDDYMYDDGGRLTAQQESDYMDYCATESEHERPYDADACQCDLDQCVIDDMWAAECDLCEGNIGCKHCCGDGGEIKDTCGTCEGYGGCYDCCFTGKRSGCGTGKCEYCKARPGADEHDEATFLCASETQALREAQVTFEQSVKENPHYQKWMGSVSNSLCGICSQPAGISSYVAACKHLFHRHCLEACQSALRCEFCKRLVSVSFEQTSELCTAADPEQALRDAILACSAKHDKKLNRKTQE
jgi:hypothetical protein